MIYSISKSTTTLPKDERSTTVRDSKNGLYVRLFNRIVSKYLRPSSVYWEPSLFVLLSNVCHYCNRSYRQKTWVRDFRSKILLYTSSDLLRTCTSPPPPPENPRFWSRISQVCKILPFDCLEKNETCGCRSCLHTFTTAVSIGKSTINKSFSHLFTTTENVCIEHRSRSVECPESK